MEIEMFDKNGQKLEIGDRVIGFNNDTGIEFMGRVEGFGKDPDGNYAEVTDQDDDVFCLTSVDIQIDND